MRDENSMEDVVQEVAEAAIEIARAITPCAAPSHDETGGYVMSLTEAVMGVTAGLCRIADAIEALAAAVDRHSDNETY